MFPSVACIYATDGNNILCSLADADTSNLVPCSHEEADTRLLLHAADAVRKGSRQLCTTFPVFHAFTDCDTVSAFCGIEKRTAWKTWKVFPEATEAFEDHLMHPDMQQ